MSSSAENKTCGVCSGIVVPGLGRKAIFTAECSHTFHFPCISNFFFYGNRPCPVCHVYWNHLPFPTSVSTAGHPPQSPAYTVEPLEFSDDEPLPADPASSSALPIGLQKVAMKVVPERVTVAASESVSLFSVLVGLKAPPLPDDARTSQRASIDIVTVLDVSGSMQGRKLDLVKRAVAFVIDNLGVSDRLSVVSFSDQATRLFPLQRMTDTGRENAMRAVNSLFVRGGTNIVEGLRKGARVLAERRYRNPVTSIIFLSDGNDTYNQKSNIFQGPHNSRNAPEYLHLLPASIYPKNRGLEPGQLETIPVHSFGFGSDHDPITMHAISDASGGTFSFIESYEMVQDAFAGCIGGLLSVVAQELRLKVRSASHGVEIKSIPSGRYASGISNQGSEGLVNVGDLYADEEKEFLINLSVPVLISNGNEEEKKTSLLDITCSYKNAISKEMIQIEGDLVEIQRPRYVSPQDMVINMEVDRQRNRLSAAESIKQAQQIAETGNLTGARNLLAKKRTDLLASASAQAGDGLCLWLEAEMKETEKRMENLHMYQQSGRAFALSGMSSHAAQRATTRGNRVAGASGPVQSFSFGSSGPANAVLQSAAFDAYATPNMANMVTKSQQQSKTGEDPNLKKA